MLEEIAPLLARRRLRIALRRQREECELTREQVADKMKWSVSKLVRIESGEVKITVNDLTALQKLLGVYGHTAEIQVALALRAQHLRSTWTASFKDSVPAKYRTHANLEGLASEITQYHPSVVPNLLQTRQYADALHRASIGGGSPEKLHFDERRRGRFRERKPEYVAIIDEGALRRGVGGQAIMVNQLDELLKYGEEPHISILVIPYAADSHPDIGFSILRFPDPADVDGVFSGDPDRGSSLDTPEEVTRFHEVVTRLKRSAISGAAAAALIRQCRDEWRRGTHG